MEQKTKKFNVVDVIIVVLLALAVVFVAWRILRNNDDVDATVHIDYTVKCENVSKEVYDNCQQYLPSQLMASGKLYDGSINSVTAKPSLQLAENGQWVEDPEHLDLYFEVECNVPAETVMTTKVGEQEIRVGKADHILKSEYIELGRCTIIDVHWSAP